MKQISIMIVFAAITGGAALGQDDSQVSADKAKLRAEAMSGVVTRARFGLMGGTVKGAPYAAEGASEITQTLSDGTHINHQETYTIYRDGEGRIRRESGDEVWISDPAGNATYVLNTRQQIARKMPLKARVTSDRIGNGPPQPPQMDKVKAEAGGEAFFMSSGPNVVMTDTPAGMKTAKLMAEGQVIMIDRAMGGANAAPQGKTESLGRQTMEGVEVEGTRNTAVIPQGQIGNDRPLQIVNERWESPDLHVTIYSKHSDPMMGERVERLMNVRRGEPDPSLFQVPAGYTIDGEK